MEYVLTYVELLEKKGYENLDKAAGLFKDYYSEYLRNRKLVSKTTGRNLRHEYACAAIATLKTNKYLGLEDEDLYDIKKIWGLEDNEYRVVAELLVDNLKKYHLDGSGVPSRAHQNKDEYLTRLARSIKNMKVAFIIIGVLLLISATVLGISSYYCHKDIDYREVEVNVTESRLVEQYTRKRRHRNRYRLEVTVSYEGKEYHLYGVTRQDERYYRHVHYEQEPITVYLYKDRMFSTYDHMQASIPCFLLRSLSRSVTALLGLTFVVFVSVYLGYNIELKTGRRRLARSSPSK